MLPSGSSKVFKKNYYYHDIIIFIIIDYMLEIIDLYCALKKLQLDKRVPGNR